MAGQGFAQGLLAGLSTGSQVFDRAARTDLSLRSLAQQDRRIDLESQRLGLAREQFGLEENKFREEIRKTKRAAARTQLDELTKALAQAKASGTLTEANKGQVLQGSGIGGALAHIARDLEVPPEAVRREIDLQLFATATPSQAGAAEGQKESAELSTRLGREPTAAEREEAAGVRIEPKLATYVGPDGVPFTVDENDPQDVANARARKAVKVGLGVSAATAGAAISSLGPLPAKSIVEIRESVDRTQGNIDALQRVVDDFRANPAAGGIAGAIIEDVGGVLTQLPVIGDVTDSALQQAGVDISEVTRVRTGARFMVSRLLETITQEKSRFTDKERELAERIQKTLSPTASNRQIIAAGTKVIEIMQASQTRQVNTLLQNSGLDLGTAQSPNNEAIDKFGEVLIKNGFTQEQAAEMIVDLIERGAL